MTTRRFTTADLESPTEGATPGSWEVGPNNIMVRGWKEKLLAKSPWLEEDLYDEDCEDLGLDYQIPGEIVLLNTDPEYKPMTGNRADMELAAAAPELAADLHRIRYALEERVLIWEKVARKLEERGDTDVAEVMLYVARSADRILNGDTNE